MKKNKKNKLKNKKANAFNIVSVDSEQLEAIRKKNGVKYINELKESEERKRKKKIAEKRLRKLNSESKSVYKVIYTGMRD